MTGNTIRGLKAEISLTRYRNRQLRLRLDRAEGRLRSLKHHLSFVKKKLDDMVKV